MCAYITILASELGYMHSLTWPSLHTWAVNAYGNVFISYKNSNPELFFDDWWVREIENECLIGTFN